MKVILSLLIIVLALIGIADAGYITYSEYIVYAPVACGGGFDCGSVLQSQWARIAGIPLSVFGLIFYTKFLILGILHYLEVDISQWLVKLSPIFKVLTTQLSMAILGTGGFLFSLYLLTLMGIIIKAWCLYCLVSAGTTTLLFLISVTLNKLNKLNTLVE